MWTENDNELNNPCSFKPVKLSNNERQVLAGDAFSILQRFNASLGVCTGIRSLFYFSKIIFAEDRASLTVEENLVKLPPL